MEYLHTKGPQDATGPPIMAPTPASHAKLGARAISQPSTTVKKRMSSSTSPSVSEQGRTDNGPQNPTWLANMKLMEHLSRLSYQKRIMREMETSDEDETPTGRGSSIRKANGPGHSEIPSWDNLSIHHKYDLADTIFELYPNEDAEEVMRRLRLNASQRGEMTDLLLQRQERKAREEEGRRNLQKETMDILLGSDFRRLSQSTYHDMVEKHIYSTIDEDSNVQTPLSELTKAKAYLKHCGYDSALAEDSWEVPFTSGSAAAVRSLPNRPGLDTFTRAADHISSGPSSQYSTQSAAAQPNPLRRDLGSTKRSSHGPLPTRTHTPHGQQPHKGTLDHFGAPAASWPDIFRQAYGDPLPQTSESKSSSSSIPSSGKLGLRSLEVCPKNNTLSDDGISSRSAASTNGTPQAGSRDNLEERNSQAILIPPPEDTALLAAPRTRHNSRKRQSSQASTPAESAINVRKSKKNTAARAPSASSEPAGPAPIKKGAPRKRPATSSIKHRDSVAGGTGTAEMAQKD